MDDQPGGGGPPDVLQGRRARLRPFAPADLDFAYRLHLSQSNLSTYRLRGNVPSPDGFHRFLWDGALANFVVLDEQGEPCAVVGAYSPDHRNGFCYIAAVGTEDAQMTGLLVEATALLISYLFMAFPFRKVYMESLAVNFESFASGEGRFFHLEGRLKDHEYVDGAYQDLVMVAVYRAEWAELSRFVYGRALPLTDVG